MLNFLRNIWDTNQKELNRIAPLVARINELEPEFIKLTDRELREKTEEFKTRLKNGETLDDLLPEAFATVREAAKRTYPVAPEPAIARSPARRCRPPDEPPAVRAQSSSA